MKKNNYIFSVFIIFSIFFFACEKQTGEISKTYSLNGKEIFENTHNIENAYILDSLLLIKNYAIKDSFAFSLYVPSTNNSYKHLLDFGRIGNGPGEFEDQVYYTTQYSSQRDLKIWVYELNENKYSLINLSNTLKNKEMAIDKVIRIKPGVSFQTLFFINDETIIGNVNNLDLKMDRLRVYDAVHDTVVKKVKLFPEIKNPKKNDFVFTQNDYNTIFISDLKYHPKKNKLVSSMYAMDRIDVFDLNGNIEHSINNHKKRILNVIDYAKRNEIRIYHYGLALTDNFIYSLHNGGELFSDITDKNLHNKIKVYDWSYNLKFTMNLDEYISYITVDEEKGTLIGVSSAEEKILKYNIKEILNDEI